VQQCDVSNQGGAAGHCCPLQAPAFSGEAVRACLTRKVSRCSGILFGGQPAADRQRDAWRGADGHGRCYE
jgi:hypothetical protein